MKIHIVGTKLFCVNRQTDRQTEKYMTKLKGTFFSCLVNASIYSYLLTYSMVQSPSWAANWFAANQEIPRISRNPKRFITALTSVRHLHMAAHDKKCNSIYKPQNLKYFLTLRQLKTKYSYNILERMTVCCLYCAVPEPVTKYRIVLENIQRIENITQQP